MMAGCDLLLMPSRYEPCGLPQMYSQMPAPRKRAWRGGLCQRRPAFMYTVHRYGTLPIVHATGGLVDSVKAWRPQLRPRLQHAAR